jgi:hypothetical protein
MSPPGCLPSWIPGPCRAFHLLYTLEKIFFLHFQVNIRFIKILRLTYRRNFPNNTDKICNQDFLQGKLFASRDLWEVDGEGIGAQKSRKAKDR